MGIRLKVNFIRFNWNNVKSQFIDYDEFYFKILVWKLIIVVVSLDNFIYHIQSSLQGGRSFGNANIDTPFQSYNIYAESVKSEE